MDYRKLALGPGAAVAALAAIAAAAATWALTRRPREGHPADDLSGDEPVTRDSRAPEHFRPDPTAIPTAAERDALRPATGPAPSFAADRGTTIG